ncbi:18901_t:CDS:2 [Rhizophagus irregularis]|nr:18901_t:CDS:2 [Rhizophagus irregularis]
MSDREMVEVNDIKFSVEIQILEVDNVKANLHGLILLMIMVKNNASLEINIEKSLISIILGYLEEDKGFLITSYTKLCSSKQERQLLEEIWENRYLNRSGIWLQRCNKKVNEIENRKGVTKGDKKRKRIISEIDEIEDVGLYS